MAAKILTPERETVLGNTIQAWRAIAAEYAAKPSDALRPIVDAGMKARAELVAAFLDYGRDVAHDYDYSKVPYEEREAASFEGLMYAADHFKPESGRFTTIARYWCDVTIRRFLDTCYTESLDARRYLKDGERVENKFDKVVYDDHLALDIDHVIEVMGSVLTKREADFLSRVFGLNGYPVGGTPTQVARDLNVSRQRGAQLYTEAIGKLKAALAA